MKQLADQMKDAIVNMQAQHGLTADQANALVAQAIAPVLTQIQAIQATELTAEQKLTQVTTAVQEIADTYAPQAQDDEPDAPAPSSAPDAPVTNTTTAAS